MSISAQDVKNLREKTGAGMMDCKKALSEVGGDFEQAVDYLKKQGLAKAVKKGDRIAAEGLVFTKIVGEQGICLELNCETDFVAKNDDFLKLGNDLTEILLKNKPADVEQALKINVDGVLLEEKINSLVAVIGERINLRRFAILTPKLGGKIGSYIHMGGKIAVMLEISGSKIGDEEIKNIGMQVAAMSPVYVDKSQVPADILEREKAIQLDVMKDSGKPAEILEKIMIGKLDKFAGEMSLLQQAYIKDTTGKKTVGQYLKEVDATVNIGQFVRYQVGEGIEKKKDDFAEEVAKMTQ